MSRSRLIQISKIKDQSLEAIQKIFLCFVKVCFQYDMYVYCIMC